MVHIWFTSEGMEEGPAARVYNAHPILATAGTSGNLKGWRRGIFYRKIRDFWFPRWTQKMTKALQYVGSAVGVLVNSQYCKKNKKTQCAIYNSDEGPQFLT